MPLPTAAPETKPARKRRRRRGRGQSAPRQGKASIAAADRDETDPQEPRDLGSHEQELHEHEAHEPEPHDLEAHEHDLQPSDLGMHSQGEASVVLETASELKPKRKRKRRRRRGGSAACAKPLSAAPVDDPRPVRPPDKIIIPFKGRFTYDTRILNDKGTGLIRLRGRRETGKRWSTEIPAEMAVRMVEEGAAGIIHPGLIHKLYTKTDFRLLILQRDAYRCHYCGRYGDTIDHVQPKSKGGLSSPGNCVCACGDCNLKKADSLDFVYYDEF